MADVDNEENEKKLLDSIPALPNKFLNPDGSYSTLQELIGSPGPIRLQDKAVAVTHNGQMVVTANEGYDGLNSVSFTTSVQPNLQTKSVTITENGTTEITPSSGYDGLEKVNITTDVGGLGKIITSCEYLFYMGDRCDNLAAIMNLIDTNTNNLNCNNMFQYAVSSSTSGRYGSAIIAALKTFDVSHVTSMYEMLSRNTFVNFNNVDLSSWDVSNVTTMRSMFYSDMNLVNLNVDGWNLANVTTLLWAFTTCDSLSEESLHSIIKALTTLTGAYTDQKTLKTIGISSTQADICVTFSEWATLQANGWTTGY